MFSRPWKHGGTAQAPTLGPPETRCHPFHRPRGPILQVLRRQIPKSQELLNRIPRTCGSCLWPQTSETCQHRRQKNPNFKKVYKVAQPASHSAPPPASPALTQGMEVSGWDPTAALPDVPACEPQAQAGRGSKWERDVPVPGASGMVRGRGLSPGLPWTAELLLSLQGLFWKQPPPPSAPILLRSSGPLNTFLIWLEQSFPGQGSCLTPFLVSPRAENIAWYPVGIHQDL